MSTHHYAAPARPICKFSTYATWWIRQAVSRAKPDQSRTIRIPVHITEHINEVFRAQGQLVQDLGREPKVEEIGRHLGIPAARVEEILKASRAPLSLETPVGEMEDVRIGDVIGDEDAVVPPDEASKILLKEELESVLGTLREREKRVIQLRFGLLDATPEPSRRWAGRSESPGSGSGRSRPRPSPSSATPQGRGGSATTWSRNHADRPANGRGIPLVSEVSMTGTRRRGGSLPRPLAGVSSNDSRASRLLKLVIERIAAGGADWAHETSLW